MLKKINNSLIALTEKGILPDFIIRFGIRLLLKKRLSDIKSSHCEDASINQMQMISKMDNSPVATNTSDANEQHYEVPADFYKLILGNHFKYSCCYWPDNEKELDDAEVKSLITTCERAALEDGQQVLDMGCGWGSLSLWIADNFPNSSVTSVSNSRTQKEFIDQMARMKGLENIEVITHDMKNFNIDKKFDRIVSIEMFEHMKNHRELFSRVSSWLKSDGLFFMHIFCHKNVPYEFIDKGPNDWMSRYFFTGGIMPSDDLPLFFQDHLTIRKRWRWNGFHYAKTCNTWLKNMDSKKTSLIPIMKSVYGPDHRQWWQRWRIFFMSCAELFAFNNGNEWYIGHYLFSKKEVEK